MTSRLLVDRLEGKTTSGTVQMPTGTCIQTVDFSYRTQVSTNSTSKVDTGLVGIITPKFSSSKIYITAFIHFRLRGVHDHGVSFSIQRTGPATASIFEPATANEYYFYDGTSSTVIHDHYARGPMFAVDSPNSTAQCTYNFQYQSMRTDNTNGTLCQAENNESHGFLMEIAQ